MVVQTNKQIALNGLHIGFLNFEGAVKKTMPNGRIKGKFNSNGARDFAIFLDEEMAQMMAADGFNVKWPKPNDDIDPEEDHRTPYLGVTVSNDSRPIPPFIKIYLIDGGVETQLDNSDAAMIDSMDIAYADIIINPYVWDVNGETGVKAYLKGIKIYLNNYDFTANYGVQ